MLRTIVVSLACGIVVASKPDHEISLRAQQTPDKIHHVALIGETIRIESNENPSTGYNWVV